MNWHTFWKHLHATRYISGGRSWRHRLIPSVGGQNSNGESEWSKRPTYPMRLYELKLLKAVLRQRVTWGKLNVVGLACATATLSIRRVICSPTWLFVIFPFFALYIQAYNFERMNPSIFWGVSAFSCFTMSKTRHSSVLDVQIGLSTPFDVYNHS